MPRNTVVKEQIHAVPLELNGRPVGHQEFVDALMSMSSEDANKTALDLMVSRWGLGAGGGTVRCTALHCATLPSLLFRLSLPDMQCHQAVYVHALGGRGEQGEKMVSLFQQRPVSDTSMCVCVHALQAKNNFNSTYAFGKHLTERMVVATEVRPGVQRAMVRPSLIAGLLGDPYPG